MDLSPVSFLVGGVPLPKSPTEKVGALILTSVLEDLACFSALGFF